MEGEQNSYCRDEKLNVDIGQSKCGRNRSGKQGGTEAVWYGYSVAIRYIKLAVTSG